MDLPTSPNSILFFHTQVHSCLRDFVLLFPLPTELFPTLPMPGPFSSNCKRDLLVTPSKAGSPGILNTPLWFSSPRHLIIVIFLCIPYALVSCLFYFLLYFLSFPSRLEPPQGQADLFIHCCINSSQCLAFIFHLFLSHILLFQRTTNITVRK